MLRQKAVAGLIDLYKAKQENCVASVNAGVIPPLLGLLKDEDQTVRETALDALTYLADVKFSRDILLDTNAIRNLKEVVDDPSVVAQVNTFRVMERLGKEPRGCVVLAEGCVYLFIRKAALGENEVKEAALYALKRAITVQGCGEVAINEHIMAVLAQIAASKECRERPSLLTICCDVTALLAFLPVGMYEAVHRRIVYSLLEFLTHPDAKLREQALNALTQITICKEGKIQCLEYESTLEPIKDIVTREEEPISNKIHALRVITNICESPNGRDIFKELLSYLLSKRENISLVTNDTSSELTEEAKYYLLYMDCLQTAINMISWEA